MWFSSHLSLRLQLYCCRNGVFSDHKTGRPERFLLLSFLVLTNNGRKGNKGYPPFHIFCFLLRTPLLGQMLWCGNARVQLGPLHLHNPHLAWIQPVNISISSQISPRRLISSDLKVVISPGLCSTNCDVANFPVKNCSSRHLSLLSGARL